MSYDTPPRNLAAQTREWKTRGRRKRHPSSEDDNGSGRDRANASRGRGERWRRVLISRPSSLLAIHLDTPSNLFWSLCQIRHKASYTLDMVNENSVEGW